MKKVLVSIVTLVGCLSTFSAMAYTSTDCNNAKELGYRDVINYQDSCKNYGLDRTTTRQEVAAITLKIGEACGTIYNIPPANQYYCENIFADVGYRNPNTWICRVAETLDRENIIESDYNNYGDRYFRPLKSITRADVLDLMLRGADLDYENTDYDSWRFTSSISTKYRPLAQYAYDNDIISSISSFSPSTNAYRRDIFNYAVKIIELCGDNSYGNNYNYGNCAMGQYYSGNRCYSCGSLPTNAFYTRGGSCDWQCNSGYYKSGNNCAINTGSNYGGCGAGMYFSNGTCYSCGTAPVNGYYAATGSCSVSCYSGYTYNSYSNTCVSGYNYNPGNCGTGQYWAGNMCLGCTTKPSYGYYTTSGSCDWECTSGYYKSGNTCVSNYNNYSCGSGQYSSNGTCYSCGSLPYNAYYISNGSCDWQCNSGYYKSGNTCVSNYNNYSCGTGQYYSNGTCYSCGTLPYNAYYTSSNSCDWQCNSGYYRSGSTCISNYNYNYNTCGVGQYYSNNTCYSCGTAPYNGSYITAGSCAITCNAGYTYNSYNNTCDYTGGGYYYGGGSNCNTSVPANAYYTSGNCWSCNAGYVQVNNLCVWWN